ncbi:MAG TPA: tetratricopeptide repeat protein [Terracidiphilus sp.]|jgi:Flp pilus assembly protein TadD|nr:tetratricopeptide repeat protein [Terracidiphilus sp.]
MKWIAAALLALAAGICLAQARQPAVQQPGADAHLSRGAQLMHDQLFDAAAGEFEKALALHPADPRAHFQYAVCLLSLGRNDEARREFEKVQKLAGESRYVTYYLGRIDLLSNDYASAIQRFRSLAENPPYPDTAFYLGVAYVSSGDGNDGTKWLERAAKLQPGDYRVHYRLARAYSSAGREQDASREYSLYNKLLNQHKSTETEVRACADALRTQPISAAAQEVCQRMFDPNDPEKLTLLGQLYGDAGAYEKALDPLTRAVQLDPNSYEAWHNLGLTYFRLQRYKEARAPLEKATALRPEAYGSVVILGATLYMLGDDEAALPVLEHAHRLNPGDAQTTAVLEKLRAEHAKK